MFFFRRILKISWKDKKTDQYVLEELGTKRTILQVIRKRQMAFLGHINRNKGLEHLALTGKIEGKKSRGRQRLNYLNNINRSTTEKESRDNISFLRLSEDRDEWRTMITDVCSRPGT